MYRKTRIEGEKLVTPMLLNENKKRITMSYENEKANRKKGSHMSEEWFTDYRW